MRSILLIATVIMTSSCVTVVEKQCREKFIPTAEEKREMFNQGIIKDTLNIAYAIRNCK